MKNEKKMWTRELITATIWNLTLSTCGISVGGTSVYVKMAVVECHLLFYSFILNMFLFRKHFKSFRVVKFLATSWKLATPQLAVANFHTADPIGKPRVSPLLSLTTSAVIRYLICVYASHFFAGRPYHLNQTLRTANKF